jgi:hypothetical protein|eukprot:SAG25_NODE_19_length_23408_cov_10.997040_8_plen_81_part_00
MEALLGFDGEEFYTSEQPSLVGLTFGEIVLRFADAIPLGISTCEAPGAVRIPHDDQNRTAVTEIPLRERARSRLVLAKQC